MFADLTVLENLKLGAYLRKDKAEIEKDLKWVYELFPGWRNGTGSPAPSPAANSSAGGGPAPDVTAEADDAG